MCNYGPCPSGGGLVSLPSWWGVCAFSTQRDQSRLPAPRAEDGDNELSFHPPPYPVPEKLLITCCRCGSHPPIRASFASDAQSEAFTGLLFPTPLILPLIPTIVSLSPLLMLCVMWPFCPHRGESLSLLDNNNTNLKDIFLSQKKKQREIATPDS